MFHWYDFRFGRYVNGFERVRIISVLRLTARDLNSDPVNFFAAGPAVSPLPLTVTPPPHLLSTERDCKQLSHT
jgi:hypothetical protein